MREAFLAALQFEGLPLLIFAVVAAGIVRGFTGFGTALIYVPLASMVLPPVWVLTVLVAFDVPGPLPMVPRALRDGDLRDVLRLVAGMLVGLPIGLWVLLKLDPVIFRWMICLMALLMLAVLAGGWRYRGQLGTPAKAALGSLAGFLGGAAGAPGPPVILFYLGGVHNPAAIRANIMLFLVIFDLAYLILLGMRGLLELEPLMIAAIVVVPYALGGLIGQAVFDPAREKLYRGVSYMVIAAAAVAGLPVFG